MEMLLVYDDEVSVKENGAKVELELKDVVRTIEIAVGLVNNCYRTYQKSSYELKILLAHAFFQKLVIQDKQIVQAVLNPPLDYLCANRLQGYPVFQLATVFGPGENRTPASTTCPIRHLWT